VSGSSIIDTKGYPALFRGVNKMSVWDLEDPKGTISFPEIRKTGANSVRIVWAITTDTFPNGTDPSILDALITNAKANHLVPMIELHDGTGNWSRLNDLVAYWTQQAIVKIIKKHRKYLLVNIGNEVGDYSVTDTEFITGYTSIVKAMRSAGIHTPLVIDAPDWGKNLAVLNNTAATLLSADPDQNLIFSVHLYWDKADAKEPNDPHNIAEQLKKAKGLNYPLIVGEVSSHIQYTDQQGVARCVPPKEVDYQTILAECHNHGIGWYAWEWGPGNSYGGIGCEVMDMTPDRMFANLEPGWAKEVALTSQHSIKKTSLGLL
jgi:mannan endo-1,4-beta-mannosidase